MTSRAVTVKVYKQMQITFIKSLHLPFVAQ